jgi:hypothetical protein
MRKTLAFCLNARVFALITMGGAPHGVFSADGFFGIGY